MGTTNRYVMMFRVTPLERIDLVRKGISAASVRETSADMGVSIAQLLTMLGLLPATANRCLKVNAPLPVAYSERIVGLYRLIGQVENMVTESGDVSGFSAARWLASWLEQPLPALGNEKPTDLMDTIEGQRLVAGLLARIPVGAYA